MNHLCIDTSHEKSWLAYYHSKRAAKEQYGPSLASKIFVYVKVSMNIAALSLFSLKVMLNLPKNTPKAR